MSLHLQRNKKIESFKIITEPVPLLSELYIQLPKPQTNRKISLAKQQQYYIPNQSHPTNTQNINQLLQSTQRYSQEMYGSQGKERISSLSKTNCSLGLPSYQTERQIIGDWARKMFKKKNLLGCHWEDKFKAKKKSLLRLAFDCFKEQNQCIQSAYLQTQSKHKPHIRRQNHMVNIGLQKLQQVITKLIFKQQRSVFSNILRFLAFQHSVRSKFMNLNLSTQQSNAINIRQAKYVHQLPTISNFSKQIYRQSPQQAYCDNYPIKQVQSAKNIPIIANQYSLTPTALIKQNYNLKKIKKQINMHTQSIMSKNSDKNAVSRELVNSKSQPHQFAIGGIGGSFKYQFNQHNYIVVQPQQYPFKHINQQFVYTSPPSPVTHQFTNFIGSKETIQNNLQNTAFTPHHLITQNKQKRNSLRPHSHNQFATSSNQEKNTINIHQGIIENRKSRSNSLTANIKISFMNKEDLRVRQSNKKLSDYQTDQNQAFQILPKLGTLQSKRLRHNYQINNYGNELIPQDYRETPKSPNYIYSVPISPLPKDSYKTLQVNVANFNPPSSPSTPSNTHSTKNIVYQSLMAIRQQKPTQSKQIIRLGNPDQQKKRVNVDKLNLTKQAKFK